MTEYLNKDVYEFDNDASASSFGWNFQANAGIFLFLKYLKQADYIKIESKLQDIEIALENGNKILAQAKSAVDYTATSNQKAKFKDAIISLAKTAGNDTMSIYISNIPNTFVSSVNVFNNSLVPYDSCLAATRQEIDDIFVSIIESISRKISTEENTNKKNKLVTIKKKIEQFDKQSLYICVIYPFVGNEQNRYQTIGDGIITFLVDELKINRDDAVSIKQRLLEYWQLKFQHNSTIPDSNIKKRISKNEFAWPIAVFLGEDTLMDVDDCLTFCPDNAIKNEVKRILKQPNVIYYERFELMNKVIRRFEEYKKENFGRNIQNIEKSFVRECGNEFLEQFKLNDDKQIQEYITKIFVQRIINNNINMKKISAGIGVKL